MTAPSASASAQPLSTPNHLAANFEKFNSYAARAMQLDEDAEVYANLAVAFEISQLRYQLSKREGK